MPEEFDQLFKKFIMQGRKEDGIQICSSRTSFIITNRYTKVTGHGLFDGT